MYNVKIYSKSNLQPSNLLMLLFYDSNSNPTFLNHSSIVPKPPIGNISPDSLPFTDSKRKPTPPRMEKVTNREREREREHVRKVQKSHDSWQYNGKRGNWKRVLQIDNIKI